VGITVEYVALARFRPSVSAAERDAALARRASWKPPAGVTPIAEYWPLSADAQVVSIFSAEQMESVLELFFEWNDVFDISVSPAVSAEEGLRIGPEVFSRLGRLQQQSARS
jgi:hypothetical protein